MHPAPLGTSTQPTCRGSHAQQLYTTHHSQVHQELKPSNGTRVNEGVRVTWKLYTIHAESQEMRMLLSKLIHATKRADEPTLTGLARCDAQNCHDE